MDPVIEKELVKLVPEGPTLLAVGIFDGIHVGHQQLIRHLVTESSKRNLLSCVVTFWPHPQAVLQPGNAPPLLSDVEERVAMLRELGVHLVIVLPFTKHLAGIGAGDFVRLLQKYLKMRGLIIGPDFALGRKRQGDVKSLRELGKEGGFTVEVIPPVLLDGIVVSSTTIRQVLSKGDVKMAQKLIGRPFGVSAEVVHGDARGRKLGFPTANLEVKAEQALPADGIYATIAHINGGRLPSVTNIGVRPTFGGGRRLVEVYILAYNGELYGQKLTIDFIDRLRDERRFTSVDELKAQMNLDVAQADRILR